MHLPQPEQQVEVRFFLLVLILDINLLHNILFEVFSYNTLIKKQLAHHVFICFHCPISTDAFWWGMCHVLSQGSKKLCSNTQQCNLSFGKLRVQFSRHGGDGMRGRVSNATTFVSVHSSTFLLILSQDPAKPVQLGEFS